MYKQQVWFSRTTRTTLSTLMNTSNTTKKLYYWAYINAWDERRIALQFTCMNEEPLQQISYG
jgi:hypothetical protein